MRNPKSVSLVALLLVFSSFASAGPIGTNWQRLVDSLKDKGVERIGTFSLSQFAKKAATVPFYPLAAAPPAVMAGSRGSAYYTTKPPAVYVSTSVSDRDPEALAEFELHELLGALGEIYHDSDTSKSSALAAIHRTQDPRERDQLIAQFARTVFNSKKGRSNLIAGGFSVGGGGDIDLIRLKNKIFEYVRQSADRDFNSSEFARHFMKVNFEPLRKGSRIALNYIFRFPSTELLSVYVPKGNEADLVRQIAVKLTSIFPSRAEEPTIEVRPSACRNGESMRIPKPSDEEVANIQNQRARFLLGCKVNPRESMGVSTSGITADYVAPDRAGTFKYECAVEAPGQSFRIPFDSALGATGVMMKSGTLLTDSDSATFTLFANAEGKILAARVAYRASRGEKESQALQRSQSGTGVAVELGAPKISMTCTVKR